jgi:hypothetical protein
MVTSDILIIISTIALPVISGFGSYIAAITKTKKDILQLREQNKLDIEKLLSQHKMDLEALERKHELEIETMEIEHKHKIELMQKEMENKLGENLFTGMISGVMNSPEVQSQMSKAMLQSMNKKKR